jgi:hypothetical protein
MNRDQVLVALRNKLRELDVDEGIVLMIAVNDMEHGTVVAGYNTKTPFYGIQFASIVLDTAVAVKKKVGQL